VDETGIAQEDIAAYVEAALALHGYALDAAQTAAVTQQFARIALIAGACLQETLAPGSEPLPLFRP
jgi:hypothetical protein